MPSLPRLPLQRIAFFANPRAHEALEQLDLLGDALERLRAERLEFEEAAARGLHGVAHADGAWLRALLQARRDVRGVTVGGVVHAQVVADAPHHHRPGVQAHAHAHRREQCRRVGGGLLQPLADRQHAVQRAAHMVFVCQRRAEQRHEAVAEELIDRAFDAMHLGHRQLEERVERVVHPLCAKALRQLGWNWPGRRTEP